MVEIFNDIRKIYQFYQPCDELARHVEFISESMPGTAENIGREDIPPLFSSVKMFPSWTPTFWINLGPRYYLFAGNVTRIVQSTDDVLLLRDAAVERLKQSNDHIFTVKFRPGGLEAVLGISQPKLAGQVVNLNEILPPAFLQKIRQPMAVAERVAMMQQFLLSSYKNKTEDYYLKFVAGCIENYSAADMQLNTSQVAERMFVTSKTINRYFHKVVGLSPKNYFSIMRTRTALTAWVNQKEQFTPYDFGYYDMSHFYKDVVKFTGQKLVNFSG
ncbi:MAG: helix-turn-helix domain-containing protein [Bacteroidota bacterium]